MIFSSKAANLSRLCARAGCYWQFSLTSGSHRPQLQPRGWSAADVDAA